MVVEEERSERGRRRVVVVRSNELFALCSLHELRHRVPDLLLLIWVRVCESHGNSLSACSMGFLMVILNTMYMCVCDKLGGHTAMQN